MRHHPFPQAESTVPSSTRRLKIALGTWVAIEARAVDPVAHGKAREVAEQAAINAAYAAIRDIDLRMHPRREGSEIARINSTTPGTPVAVQPDTWQLLQLARRLHELTGGIFDPCLPSRPGRLSDIEIQPNTPILICHAPVELDLGGMAKGHAIDCAMEKLQELGCTSGLVNAGGDLRVFGDRAEEALVRASITATASDNGAATRFHPLTLQNAALAVSDLDATEHPVEHQGYYNRSDSSTTSITSRYAAVIANTAAVADALTKCVLLCPSDLATRALQEFAARPALSRPAI